MSLYKSLGVVTEVFKTEETLNLNGNIGVGHVRYPTAGCDNSDEAQPFYSANPVNICLAHNGTLTNSDKIKKRLLKTHFCQFNTESDSEVLLNLLAYELYKTNFKISKKHVFDALKTFFLWRADMLLLLLWPGLVLWLLETQTEFAPLFWKTKDSYRLHQKAQLLARLIMSSLGTLPRDRLWLLMKRGG